MKKFFEEKKRELKFKRAGPGHKLSQGSSTALSSGDNPSSASLNAALQRCAKQNTEMNLPSSSQEPKGDPGTTLSSKEKETRSSPVCSIGNEILFSCDQFANELHPLSVWKDKIRTHISDIKSSDPVYASILTIKSLNNSEEVLLCISLIEKYIRNLIDHPDVEKYKLIRLGNSNVKRMLTVEGAVDFLHSIGFKTQHVFNEKEQKEDEYLIFYNNNEIDLHEILKSLMSVNGFILSLHRNLKIILPNEESAKNEDLPDEFYEWSTTDLKKEHKFRKSELEKNLQLRTQKMREGSDNLKPKTVAEYTLIRVRLPDGLIIEGTFSTSEKLTDLRVILDEKIEFLDKFIFVSPPTKTYSENDERKSFLDLGLYPAVLLLLKWSDFTNKEQKYILRQNV